MSHVGLGQRPWIELPWAWPKYLHPPTIQPQSHMLLTRRIPSLCKALNRNTYSPLYTNRSFRMAPIPPKDTRPLIISGPSGVGKGTLYSLLLQRNPSTFCTSISHTTRDPRPGETRDKDYYYVSMQDFEDLIAKDGFVEHAKFGGNRYGTSKRMIEEKQKEGSIVVLDIEMEVCLASFFFLSICLLCVRGERCGLMQVWCE